MMADGLKGVNGSARPRLLRLPGGPVLLAGGRYTKDSARWTNAWAVRTPIRLSTVSPDKTIY